MDRPRRSPRSTAYRGALNNRLTEDWILASIRSADAEIRGDLRTLRKRAREKARNTPHCARYADLLADNIIGAHGIRLQSRPRLLDGEVDQDAARKIEDAWAEWTEPNNCSADGKMAWQEIEELFVQTEAQDGESLVQMLPGFDNEFGFAVQFLDADQLDDEHSRPAQGERNEIRMGVEINDWGRPLRYWVYDAHPFDFQGAARRKRIPVPASRMIHKYQIRRPGQTRGVSWFAPILLDAQMLSALQEAELISSRIASSKSGVFEWEDPSMYPDPDLPSGTADFQWDMEPAVFDTLPPGLKAHFFDPQHPNSAFEGFNKLILHTIAAGLKTSYASLTGDLRDVNFSSIRIGALQERDVYQRLQRRTYTHLHRRVFREWLRWALAMGKVDLPVRDRSRLQRHEWQPRGWDWVDPLKDVMASALAIRLGIDSRTRIAAERGRDFADVAAEIAREENLAEKLGIELSTDASRSGGASSSEDLAWRLAEADDDELADALSQLNGRREVIAALIEGETR